MFWSQWMGKYWNADVIRWLAEDWQITMIRLAMGADQGGYVENPGEKDKVITCVDAAIAAGIYVVIDWHDHMAEQHTDQAKGFFNEMASRYGSYANVLFEIYNEPINQPWSTIKWYAEQVIPVIRAHSNNIIIVGTPKWSSEPDVAASDPVGGTNLAYTIHFYAATHGESLRSRVLNAKVWGQAVFATEWGTCEASGDGYVDVGSTHTWLGFLAHHHISDANWAIADKNEACAALQPGASANGGWPRSMLTESGKYIKDGLTGNWWQVGCCKFGNDCADCGEDGTGWCHQSPGNCATCGGWMDGGAPLHNCR